jgi:molybdate transport system ATP-binding protein
MEENPQGRPVVALEGVTVRLRDFHLLHDTTWRIHQGEQWVVIGPNGSGKSALVRALAGDVPTSTGRRILPEETNIQLVSFESQQALIARERDLDHSRYFAGRPGDGITPAELFGPADSRRYAELFQFSDLLHRPFRLLSAGEMRKAVIIRSLLKEPNILVLDEPYDGLDGASRDRLSQSIDGLIEEGTQVVLVTHRREEIPDGATHAVTTQNLVVARRGTLREVLDDDHMQDLFGFDLTGIFSPGRQAGGGRADTAPDTDTATVEREPAAGGPALVEFCGADIGHGKDFPLIRDFTWTVSPGEHWVVTGPNGSGKTTLINLISGTDQKAYAVDLCLFGRPRGSGESLWDLRERIGVVTPSLQLNYSPAASVLETVLSGYYGSVGLFRRPTEEQLKAARKILEEIGLEEAADLPISRLSYGQQRLVLIARALVRQPDLLLLDEPCQGLDPANRASIVDGVDRVCRSGRSTVIYITHHSDEIPRSIHRRLELSGNGGYRTDG